MTSATKTDSTSVTISVICPDCHRRIKEEFPGDKPLPGFVCQCGKPYLPPEKDHNAQEGRNVSTGKRKRHENTYQEPDRFS